MQERHFRGYKLYDDRTSFALEFGGFRGFNARAQGTLYKQAHAAAFDLMDRIEKLENVNVTKHPTESEDRPVDHYNLRMECEVKGRSLAKSIALWNTVKAFAKKCIDAKDYDHVIYNGIGGSYLGPYLLLTAKYGDDFNMALRARGCRQRTLSPTPILQASHRLSNLLRREPFFRRARGWLMPPRQPKA